MSGWYLKIKLCWRYWCTAMFGNCCLGILNAWKYLCLFDVFWAKITTHEYGPWWSHFSWSVAPASFLPVTRSHSSPKPSQLLVGSWKYHRFSWPLDMVVHSYPLHGLGNFHWSLGLTSLDWAGCPCLSSSPASAFPLSFILNTLCCFALHIVGA